MGVGRCSPQYRLPSRDEITGIRVLYILEEPAEQSPGFDLPEKYWDAIFTSIRPYKREHDPLTWRIIAATEISTGSNQRLRISFYDARPLVAFSVISSAAVGSGWQTYYRGGSRDKLYDTLKLAPSRSRRAAYSPLKYTRIHGARTRKQIRERIRGRGKRPGLETGTHLVLAGWPDRPRRQDHRVRL